jgi:alkaline phosphatase
MEIMKNLRATRWAVLCACSCLSLLAQPSAKILLPERTRLLQGQLVDLVVEVRNAKAITGLKVTAGANDITSNFGAATAADLDCGTPGFVVRANLQSFNDTGSVTLAVSMTADGTAISDSRTIDVKAFQLPADGSRRNVILFIGDAMGTAYRDAARLVSRSIVDANGKNALREGFFDNLLEMDKMPVSGMSMTYGSDSVVPDSANTGSAWATGNKTFLASVNSLADGTDCKWRFNGQTNATNLQFMLDNPRVENLWQYLKRRFQYRTGIVTTADVTDATPAVEGSYTAYRQARAEIARQYLANPMLNGQPAFDVILGGGIDQFVPAGRTDKRNLVQEFQNLGFRYVNTATDLKNISGGQPVLGLFRGNPTPAANSAGLAASDSNMTVAYDKLGLPRPASEAVPNAIGNYTDQPMLDAMTQKAIDVLSGSFFSAPGFILMVEGASIDKESHPNNIAGTVWDTIEFDKAIGVARAWAGKRPTKDTLIVVTADHDQSLSIIGVSNIPDTQYFDRTTVSKANWSSPRGDQAISVYGDSYSNARAGLPFINSSGNGDFSASRVNTGSVYMPGTFALSQTAADPFSDTYVTYSGFPAYSLDSKTGYPTNSAATVKMLRRLAVGFRTGDHTGSSVPVTAEGPGAFLFTGYMDESDIFFKMAVSLSGDTADGDKFIDTVLTNSRYPKTIGK